MTKAELINRMAQKSDYSKAECEKMLNLCLECMKDIIVNDGKLTLIGFGTFVVEERKERKGRNPQTGEEIIIPATKVVKFRPGKALKEAVK